MKVNQDTILVVGLMFQCPMDFCLETCVFQEIRGLVQTGNNPFEILKDISYEKIYEMMELHRECLRKREG